MNSIRIAIGDLFSAPVQNMSFITYMQYVNTNGKITSRSLMDIMTILLTKIEDQEKQLEQHEKDFEDIQQILAKLVDKKVESKAGITGLEIKGGMEIDGKHIIDEEAKGHICLSCSKKVKTKLALAGHMRSHKPASTNTKV